LFQLTALYDYLPSINDTQPHIAWLAVQQEALINLSFLVTVKNLRCEAALALPNWLGKMNT
jgi:hypothetical protein